MTIIVEDEIEIEEKERRFVNTQVTEELFVKINDRVREKKLPNRSVYIRSLIQRDIRDAEKLSSEEVGA